MQQFVCKNICSVVEPVESILHLNQKVYEETSKNPSMPVSDSDQDFSLTEDFNINFDNCSEQDFGLEYWLKHTNKCPSPSSPFQTHNSLFNSNLTNCKPKQVSHNLSYKKSMRPKKSEKLSRNNKFTENLEPKLTKLKHIYNDIPRLKIPKDVLKNYFKNISPKNVSQSSSESESELSSYPLQFEKSKKKSEFNVQPESISCSSSIFSNSNCLEKSFESSNNSYRFKHLSVINNDVLHLSLTIDCAIYHKFLGYDVATLKALSPKNDLILKLSGKEKDSKITEISTPNCVNSSSQTVSKSQNNSNLIPPAICNDSLSFVCDILSEKKIRNLDHYTQENQEALYKESSKNINTNLSNGSSRKRSYDSRTEEEDLIPIITKKKFTEHSLELEVRKNENVEKDIQIMTPLNLLKLIMVRQKAYENVIMDKYCLSQPNAMKFLADSHANKWELRINIKSLTHFVPCEFLNEMFHRALYCFGLEKKTLKDTFNGNLSPINGCHSSHFTEYKKIRDEYSFSLKRARYGIGVIDEYSFSLKRARYGIGVIDELFRRNVNYQNIPHNDDVYIVRKWKHIIYYLCLHVKSAFMAKEIQYHNYIQFSSNSFDGVLDLYPNTTPSLRFPSNTVTDTYNKSQLTKDSSKLFEFKHSQKITPEHFSHSDLEMSPHSYDSGKGSSIRTSSNANSLISGCHTTSSLNSTPHSLQELQPNLFGFQLYRIDEYQSAAQECIRLLPEAFELHNKIISIIGIEPNANSRDNIIKLIHYIDLCLHMSRDDLMNECLQRLLSQALRL